MGRRKYVELRKKLNPNRSRNTLIRRFVAHWGNVFVIPPTTTGWYPLVFLQLAMYAELCPANDVRMYRGHTALTLTIRKPNYSYTLSYGHLCQAAHVLQCVG